MQPEWKIRILEALDESLRVVARRRNYGSIEHGNMCLSELERNALATIILERVLLQMQPSLRGHLNYRKACQVLEGLPLWSLDREVAIDVIDTLSSILGLPFRLEPENEDSRPHLSLELLARQKIEEARNILGQGSFRGRIEESNE